MLLGTYPGYGYQNAEEVANRRFFRGLLAWAAQQPAVAATGTVHTRLSRLGDSLFLWVFNYGSSTVATTCSFAGPVRLQAQLRGETAARALGDTTLALSIPAKDAVVVELEADPEQEWA